jgi:hypothetical protein
MYNISEKYFSRLVFFAKILIIAGAYYIISGRIMDHGSFDTSLLTKHMGSFKLADYSFVLLLFIFTLTNWALEIIKWKSLVQFIKPISYVNAARQSLASLTASLITPNRIGEYGAKAIYYQKNERSKILLLNFISNVMQMSMTLIFGCLGSIILWDNMPVLTTQRESFAGFVIVFILCVATAVFLKNKWLGTYVAAKNQILKIPHSILKKSGVYSFLRYLVFSHQFYLFLLFFNVDIEYNTAMSIIFLMYFISSVIPGFVLFDWLVKGSVAVSLFGFFGVNELVILSITSLMWMLNFALPSMVGMVFVLTFNGSSLMLRQRKVTK